MPLHPPIAAVILILSSALAQAGPPVSSDVIQRPVKPTAQAPTGTIGFSASHMDRSVDPRQDFYAYANGNWLNRLKIPDAESKINGFSMLGANLDVQLQQLAVQASQAAAPKGSPMQQVGDYYRAALDMRQRDAAGLQPIQADLDWAARASGPADLAQLSLRLQASAGGSPLLKLMSMADMKDSSRTLLTLQMGTLQLEHDQYSDPAARRSATCTSATSPASISSLAMRRTWPPPRPAPSWRWRPSWRPPADAAARIARPGRHLQPHDAGRGAGADPGGRPAGDGGGGPA